MSLTSDDLNQIKTIVEGVVVDATKGFATKQDLDRMEARLTTSIGLLERDSYSRLDEHEHRITRLERVQENL